jgi:hypothetical protein
MTNNPSDTKGPLQQQMFVEAVVVSDKDPKKKGRFLCRIHGEQDDRGKIPDSKLSWYQCIVPNKSQLRGVGQFPPGRYAVGSKVMLLNLGQQAYKIIGSMANNEDDESTADIHPQVAQGQKKVTDIMGNVMNRWWNGSKPPTQIPTNTQEAYNLLNNITKTIQHLGDPIDPIIKQAVTPDKYGKRPGAKVLEGQFKSFGREMFSKMDMKNPTKEVQRLSQELIPKAISMIETLKKTAQSGAAILATNSFGGLSNITSGLKGIASYTKAEQDRDNEADTASLLEELLRQLYRLLMKKEPLDQNGRETVQYKKWKEAYLRGEVEIANG